MIAIAAAWFLSAVASPQPWPPPAAEPTVRICSLAAPAGGCTELSAAALDPTLRPESAAAGLTAFIDPATGALADPTAEQVRELSTLRAYEKQRGEREAVTIETLPDGTRRATLGPGFMVDLVVDAAPAPPPRQDPPR